MNCYDTFECPVGPLWLLSDGSALTGVYFERHPGAPAPNDWGTRGADRVLKQAIGWFARYFDGEVAAFDFELKTAGTPFQERVWAALRGIPSGETISYAQLARRVGAPTASRAVGAAVGRNPHSIIVPCHRVVGSDGKLTGYAGGFERKRWLLAHEHVDALAKAAGSW